MNTDKWLEYVAEGSMAEMNKQLRRVAFQTKGKRMEQGGHLTMEGENLVRVLKEYVELVIENASGMSEPLGYYKKNISPAEKLLGRFSDKIADAKNLKESIKYQQALMEYDYVDDGFLNDFSMLEETEGVVNEMSSVASAHGGLKKELEEAECAACVARDDGSQCDKCSESGAKPLDWTSLLSKEGRPPKEVPMNSDGTPESWAETFKDHTVISDKDMEESKEIEAALKKLEERAMKY